MKKLLPLFIFCEIAFAANAQHTYIDRAPSGRENRRAVEGGSMTVPIDTVSSLTSLIMKLNSNWQFVETGKAYWIGYTDDMHSIDARKENAIEPLLGYIKTSANDRGKLGAIYCLHLIGINSRIVGRFYEEFTNKKARQALLSLLSENSMRGEVMHLLMRDPWQSDIPVLLSTLRQPSEANWEIVNALKFHYIPGLPIRQPIPDEIAEIDFAYPRAKSQTFQERIAAETRNEMNAYDAQVFGVLRAIRTMNKPGIQVEDSLLLERRFWGRSATEFGCKNCIGVGGKRLMLKTFLETMAESRVQYFVAANTVVICTSNQARQRILTWWDAQPAAFKAQFNRDKADARAAHQIRWDF